MEFAIKPKSARFDESDERWRDQVVAFLRDLREEGVGVRTESKADPDKHEKGPAAEIVLALGSSGALTAAVTMFQAWLARDKTRSLEIEVGEGAQRRWVSVRADDLNAEVFEEIARGAAREFGDEQ